MKPFRLTTFPNDEGYDELGGARYDVVNRGSGAVSAVDDDARGSPELVGAARYPRMVSAAT
jgi:hypothetical protein